MPRTRSIGNIEKRGPNKYRLTVDKGFDADGNRIRYRKTISAKNNRAAENELALFITEIDKGMFINNSGYTVKELAELFLKQYCEKNLAPRTYYSYKYELEKRILPHIGHIKIKDLKPLHLASLYNKLRDNGIREDGKEGGLSARTVRYNHSIISCMFNHAKKWEIIASNPAEKVTPPKEQRKEAKHYDESQVERLLEALKQAPMKYSTAVVLDLVTGMRRGELLALEWSDIDFKNRTITINKASQYIPYHGIITKQPKTESSNRTISIPGEVVTLLQKYKEWQDGIREDLGNLWVESNRLFTKDKGEPMHTDTLSKWFKNFINKNNLSDLNFHGLRHTSATLLSAMGIGIPSISKGLGHSKPSTTSYIYAHALKRVDHHASEIIGNALSLDKFAGSLKEA